MDEELNKIREAIYDIAYDHLTEHGIQQELPKIMALIDSYSREAVMKETAWHLANLAYEVGYSGSPHAESERVLAEKRIKNLSEVDDE
jgi:hypothetical protein